MKKRHIAIIGGGPAGLSAAFHLAQKDEWDKDYSITVYQPGWRLGGKGATGRNEEYSWRIEEHGIHGFCRFYFNTWLMMKQVYDGLTDADRKKLATGTIKEAFLPSSLTYSVSSSHQCFHPEVARYRRTNELPWDENELKLDWDTILTILTKLLQIRDSVDENTAQKGKDIYQSFGDNPIKKLVRTWYSCGFGLVRNVKKTEAAVSRALRQAGPGLLTDFQSIREQLDKVQKKVRSDIKSHSEKKLGHNRGLALLDILVAMFIGLIDDDLIGKEIDEIDDKTIGEWLAAHGATVYSLTSQVFVAVPNILFSAPEGNGNEYPDLSAASWLTWTLRGLLGKGDFFYFMAAGTGESVILPIYLYLKRQGVKFEFFHKLKHVEFASSGANRNVSALKFERQAEPAASEYDPLIDIPLEIQGKARNCWAWPNQPKYADLVDGESKKDIDFEAWDGTPPDQQYSMTLSRADEILAGQEKEFFTHVVFAMPPSMIKLVGLGNEGKWSDVNEHMKTTPTQAAQVWLTKSTEDLGWKIPTDSKPEVPPESLQHWRYASANFPNPLNAMVAFDDVIAYEGWQSGSEASEIQSPKGLIYLCSQIQPLNEQDKAQDLVRVQSNLAASLRLMGNFFDDDGKLFMPDGETPGEDEKVERHDWMTVDFDLLYHVGEGEGLARLDSQYIRVNTDPMDAYVQAPAGSAGHRIHSWETGLVNAVAAGDWIYTGFNIGAFESAVTGGKLAAFALTNVPELDSIVGFDFLHPKARKDAEEALSNHKVPIIPNLEHAS